MIKKKIVYILLIVAFIAAKTETVFAGDCLNQKSFFYKIMNIKNINQQVDAFIETSDELDECERLILVSHFLKYVKDDESMKKKLIRILLDKEVNVWVEFGYIDDFLKGVGPQEVFEKVSDLLLEIGISLKDQNSMHWLQRDLNYYKYNMYRIENRIKELAKIFPDQNQEYITTRLKLEELFLKKLDMNLEKKEQISFRSTVDKKVSSSHKQSFVLDLIERDISLTKEEYNELDELLQKAEGLNIHIINSEIYYWECLDVYSYIDIRKIGAKEPVIRDVRLIEMFRVNGICMLKFDYRVGGERLVMIKNKELISVLDAEIVSIEKITDTVLHIEIVKNKKYSLYSFNGEEIILLIDEVDKIFEFKSVNKSRYKKYTKNNKDYLARIEKNIFIPILAGVNSIGEFIKYKNDIYITYKIGEKHCLGRVIEDKVKMILCVDRIMSFGDVVKYVDHGSWYYSSMDGDVLAKIPKNLIDCNINITKVGRAGYLLISEEFEKQSLYILNGTQVTKLRSDISHANIYCTYKNNGYLSYKQNGKIYFSVIIAHEIKDLIIFEDKKYEPKEDKELLDDIDDFMSIVRSVEMQFRVIKFKRTATALYVVYKQLGVSYLLKIQDKEVVYKVCLGEGPVINEIEEFEGALYFVKRSIQSLYALLKIEHGKIVWSKNASWIYLSRVSDENLYVIFESQKKCKIVRIKDGKLHRIDMKGHKRIDKIMKIGREIYFSYIPIEAEFGPYHVDTKPLYKLAKIVNNKVNYFEMKEIGKIMEKQEIGDNIYIKHYIKHMISPDGGMQCFYGLTIISNGKVINLIDNAYHIEKIESNADGEITIIYYNYDNKGYDKVVSAKKLYLNISNGKEMIEKQDLEIIGFWPGMGKTKYYVQYEEEGNKCIKEIKEEKILKEFNNSSDLRTMTGSVEVASQFCWERYEMNKRYLYRLLGNKIVEILSKTFYPKEKYPYVCINDKQVYFKDTTINKENIFVDENAKKAYLTLKAIVPHISKERRVTLSTAKFLLDPKNRYWIKNVKAYPQKADIYISNMLNIDNYGDFVKDNFNSKFIQHLLFNMLEDEETSVLFKKIPEYFLDFLVDAYIGKISATSVSASLRRILNTKKREKELQRYIKDILTIHEYIGDIEKDILFYRIPSYLTDDRMVELLKNWDIKNRMSFNLQNKMRLKMFNKYFESGLRYLKIHYRLNEFMMKTVLEFSGSIKKHLIKDKKILEKKYVDYKNIRTMLVSS